MTTNFGLIYSGELLRRSTSLGEHDDAVWYGFFHFLYVESAGLSPNRHILIDAPECHALVEVLLHHGAVAAVESDEPSGELAPGGSIGNLDLRAKCGHG